MDAWKMYALGSALFAGPTAILAKVGVKDIPSNFATLIRTFIIIIIILTMLVGFRHEWQNPLSLNRKSLIFLLLSGIATGLSWLCYFRALQIGPAALVAPLDKLSLVFSVVFAVMFLGERLSVMQWGGALLMTAGALMMAFK